MTKQPTTTERRPNPAIQETQQALDEEKAIRTRDRNRVVAAQKNEASAKAAVIEAKQELSSREKDLLYHLGTPEEVPALVAINEARTAVASAEDRLTAAKEMAAAAEKIHTIRQDISIEQLRRTLGHLVAQEELAKISPDVSKHLTAAWAIYASTNSWLTVDEFVMTVFPGLRRLKPADLTEPFLQVCREYGVKP